MNDRLKEKLSDSGFAQKLKKETSDILEELYLKDLQCVASILDIPIDKDGNTMCTETRQTQFLAFIYGILLYQIFRLENAKNSIFADIKKMDSDVAEKLTDLKIS